jgi:predicted RNase H-like HicB family nuclease
VSLLKKMNMVTMPYTPELEGCQSQGDTLEEVLDNIKEAVELYLETLTEEERKEVLSQAILTTTLEVELAYWA